MAKNFDITTILSMITGVNYTDDLSKVYELVWFVCKDKIISPLEIKAIKEDVKKHLLTLYPEFANIKNIPSYNFNKFLINIEKEYGMVLPVTKLGMQLPEEDIQKIR